MNFDPEAFKRLVEEKGEVTVCDPAVGSGVMLLSYAKVVHETFGRWGTDRLRLYGQDIDPRCVAMCRIQLGLNGLDGIWRGIALAGACSASRESAPGQLILPGLAEWRVA
jgi:type I restriction-modification system DNA methylase subunit